MPEIIASNDSNVNSQSTSFSSQTIAYKRISRLTKFHREIMKIYLEARRAGIDKADYSLKELSFRLKRDAAYISRNLVELERNGWLKSDPHGSANKKRWITRWAFSMLDDKHPSQMTSQTSPVPYIDLTDRELINSQILKSQQKETLTQKERAQNKTITEIIEEKPISHRERLKINNLLNQHRIGKVRISEITDRFIRQNNKKSIERPYAYLKTCFNREEEQLKLIFKVLHGKNMKVNLYAEL